MPIETTENEIRVRVEDPSLFEEDSFRRITIDESRGIYAIIGKKHGDDKTSVQSLRFLIDKGWTESKARKWTVDHGYTIKKVEVVGMKSANITQELVDKAKHYLRETKSDVASAQVVREYGKFSIKQMPSEEECKGIWIKGYLSTFNNVDRQNDIVSPGAFNDTVNELKVAGKLPMQKDHCYGTDDQIGSWSLFEIDSKGLYVEGYISCTDKTEHIITLIKDGHLDTLSMGGIFFYGDKDSAGHDIITKVVLLEGSVVSIPANSLARFSQKSLVALDDFENVDLVGAKNLQLSGKSKVQSLKELYLKGKK